MKKLLLILSLLMATNLQALSSISAIPVEEKKLLNSILMALDFEDATQESKMKIYRELKPFLENGWYAHWLSNSSGSDSKVSHADAKFADIMIYNNDRVANVTLIYFKHYNQIFVSSKETIELASVNALENFKKKEQDSKFNKLNETDNYALFNKSGFMEYQTAHIKGANAMMVYETANYINVASNAAPKEERLQDYNTTE